MASSMALRAGADIWQASYLGSLAAALQVSRVGNLPLTTGRTRHRNRRSPASATSDGTSSCAHCCLLPGLEAGFGR